MPNTLIQIKRASTVTIPILDAGEPAIDFDTGILYVGDGSTNPGLSFLSTSASLTPHSIDGASHSVTSSIVGGTLRIPEANNLVISRLGYYDLGSSSGVDYGAATDVAGSRKHWMDLEHVAKKPYCIFYSDLDYENEYHDMSHFPNAAGSNPTPTFGNKIYELSYANTGSTTKVLVSAADSGGLGFRQLTADDIDGLDISTSITSMSGLVRSIFITKGGNSGTASIEALQYGYTTGQDRKYLQVAKGSTVTTSVLSFGSLNYQDLVGDFNFGSATAQDRWTLRYKKNVTDGTGWTPTGILKVYSNTSSAATVDFPDTTSCGITIDNSGTSGKTGRITFNDYRRHSDGGSNPDILTASFEILMLDAIKRRGTYDILSNNSGPVFSVGAGQKRLSFAVTSNYLTQYPNLQFDHVGNINIWSPSTLPTLYGIVDNAGVASYTGINFREKTISFESTSRSTLPSYHIINSAGLTIVYNHNTANNIVGDTSVDRKIICGVELNSISMNTGSAGTDKRHSGRFFSCENLSTSSSAHGMYINSITTNHNTTASRIVSGIQINSIESTEASGTGVRSVGLAVHKISSSGSSSAGLCLGISLRSPDSDDGITGKKTTYGMYISRVTSTGDNATTDNEAYGIRVADVSSQWGNVYGLRISNVVNRNADKNVYGILVNTLTSEHALSNAFGCTIFNICPNLVSIGSPGRRIVGLYVDAMASSKGPTSSGSVPSAIRYGIYARAERNFLSGTTICKGDVYLNSILTDGVKPATDVDANYSGSTHTSNLYVHGLGDIAGDLNVSGDVTVGGDLTINGNLIMNGTIHEGVLYTDTFNAGGMTQTVIQSYRVLVLHGDNNITGSKLGKGYPGQILTIVNVNYQGESNVVNLLWWQIPYTSAPVFTYTSGDNLKLGYSEYKRSEQGNSEEYESEIFGIEFTTHDNWGVVKTVIEPVTSLKPPPGSALSFVYHDGINSDGCWYLISSAQKGYPDYGLAGGPADPSEFEFF